MDETNLARILDASANRAREALRVLEDYCRFVLNDAVLSGELKQMRHGLADALATLPVNQLLEARETERDVGRALTAPGEESRHGLHAVVEANCKRLQEALRSLEEFAKIPSPLTTHHSPLTNVDLGRALEKLRYQSYTIERALTLGALARERLAEVRLCVLVTESELPLPSGGEGWVRGLESIIKEAAAGGATMIQLREKNLNDRQLLELARNVRRWTSEAGVLLIVNDRPDIARLSNADGVHLGQDDLPVMEARQILGPDRLIGVSTHNLDQVRQAILDGASYLGVGPAFPGGTKEFTEFPGLDFVSRATQETGLPIFVIGGVTLQNIAQVVSAGARRIAVSQAVCQSSNPRQAAEELLRLLTPDS